MILRVNEKNMFEQKPGYLLSSIAPLEDTVVFQLLLMPDDKRLGLGWWVVGGWGNQVVGFAIPQVADRWLCGDQRPLCGDHRCVALCGIGGCVVTD